MRKAKFRSGAAHNISITKVDLERSQYHLLFLCSGEHVSGKASEQLYSTNKTFYINLSVCLQMSDLHQKEKFQCFFCNTK